LAARVRRRPGCGDARALDAWGEGVSGVCWFAKHAAAAAQWRQAPSAHATERSLVLLARGNLRKQGTITRRVETASEAGSRYKKQRDLGRHSLVEVTTSDLAEGETLRDFASIGHPVLGALQNGDHASNQFMGHRHGLDRPFVHCASSRLRVSRERELYAESELSPDLSRVVASLGSD
jgi:hypothetical protein